jgi:hypothetical protein
MSFSNLSPQRGVLANPFRFDRPNGANCMSFSIAAAANRHTDGVIAFAGEKGPWGFSPEELKEAIERLLSSARD